MASSGISGVSAAAVGYVRAALLPGQTPAEAAAAFARMIHSALRFERIFLKRCDSFGVTFDLN